jgi:hypothetical protein
MTSFIKLGLILVKLLDNLRISFDLPILSIQIKKENISI